LDTHITLMADCDEITLLFSINTIITSVKSITFILLLQIQLFLRLLLRIALVVLQHLRVISLFVLLVLLVELGLLLLRQLSPHVSSYCNQVGLGELRVLASHFAYH